MDSQELDLEHVELVAAEVGVVQDAAVVWLVAFAGNVEEGVGKHSVGTFEVLEVPADTSMEACNVVPFVEAAVEVVVAHLFACDSFAVGTTIQEEGVVVEPCHYGQDRYPVS